MKKVLLFAMLILAVSTLVNAQGLPTGKRQHKPVLVTETDFRNDSLLWIKNPANEGKPYIRSATQQQIITGATKPNCCDTLVDPPEYCCPAAIRKTKTPAKTVVQPASQNQPAGNKTKLDDLKNPFDTTKKATINQRNR